MGRQRLAIIIAFVTIVGGIPAVGAEHLSVGYEDAPGVAPDEAPEDKSVDADAYDRGTKTECFASNGSSADEIQESRDADPFCGELRYQDDNELAQESPKDQTFLSDEIGTFDVRATRSYMLAHEARLIHQDEQVGACQPFCEDNLAGQLAWEAVHTAGSEAGLTDNAGDADDKEREDRLQIYGADIHTPTARYALQEAGTHEMDGWLIPGTTRSFVAFLEDGEGDPIGEDRLSTMVGDADLPQGAIPSICGWTPGRDFGGTGDAATCEVEFEFEGNREQRSDFKGGYNDKCASAGYVCGASAGGAWYANFDLLAPFATTDYVKWHWVVAPTLPECGVQEPGFQTETDTQQPFLAHDVDVYTPATALANSEDARNSPVVADTALEVGTTQAEEVLEDGTDALPDTPVDDPLPEDTPADEVSTSAFLKGDRVEPNAAPDANPLEDTSQSLLPDEDLTRSVDDPCEQLQGSETEDTIDPWVDLIDGETVEEATTGVQELAETETGVSSQTPGLYGDEAPSHDDDNHPGPEIYHTSGNVGMFTDKDDDGAYDTLPGDTVTFSGSKLDSAQIEEVGAYPMIWDVRVQETQDGFELDEGASGCQVNGIPLTKGAAQAGYGGETGLFQAVYLQEPTVVLDDASGEATPYVEGNNIYLFLSNSARTMYDSDTDTELDGQIDSVLAELSAYAKGQVGTAPDVVRPGDEFGRSSDYGPQCIEDTGGFSLELSFTHTCQVDCSGDTIVTGYTFEADRPEGTIGGGDLLPVFEPQNEGYDFGEGTHTWIDVDPFDNDSDRNADGSSAPPTGE